MESMFEKIISAESLKRAWETVYSKHPACGIDDVDVEDYSRNLSSRLNRLHKSLLEGNWIPSPYLDVNIPKRDGDTRTISLSVMEDKIVQTSVKSVIEPLLERTFSSGSYAYRPGRGHLRCVRRALSEMRNQENVCFIHGDIDNYFDSINRALLIKRLTPVILDEKVRRLIELCISMGRVSSDYKWHEPMTGIPQGATLSPLLANYYLNPFDQSVASGTRAYVRYSDDFIIWCRSEDEAWATASKVTDFLSSRLGLNLNENLVPQSNQEGLEFLGLYITPEGISLTEKKIDELSELICGMEMSGKHLDRKYVKNIEGIRRYYIEALPSSYYEVFTLILDKAVDRWREEGRYPGEKVVDDIYKSLIGEKAPVLATVEKKPVENRVDEEIKKRRTEYRRLEAENSELIISSPGYYVGAGVGGLIVRKHGQPIKIRSAAVKNITILSQGVTFSSNLVEFCSTHGIGLTFLGKHNALSSALLSQHYLGTSLWDAQKSMSIKRRQEMARRIISAKMRNQENLCKYFNKYAGNRYGSEEFDSVITRMEHIRKKTKNLDAGVMDSTMEFCFQKKLMAYEADFADLYWGQVRSLLMDVDVEFYSRVKQGAKDLVNSMLNYGYALLYSRIWHILMKRQLNPQIGFIHYADGNANLVFDFIELFRCQAVDRVVISMLRRREHCNICEDGLLDEETKKKLSFNIMERLNRYEIYRGESRKFLDIMDIQAIELAKSVSDDVTFKAYSAKW